ncbi:MAG TPA: type I phosphomannose isomerase catalytic subunit [Candidatus Acidoferrales bacterium]|nr:type I phosphomannose isomerase catalytic subunit [Candidatus Acidoferrales bacterium]
MIVCPARLEPTFSPRPWGSLSLAPLFPEKSNLAEPLGEAWMTGNESRFASGPFAGKTLGEAWPEMPPEWAGTRADQSGAFPLLVKFIFPEEKLSVQVHPDDDYASQREREAGGRGKTEMWYVLRARPGAEVMVGLKSSVTRGEFQRAIADGTAEKCLEHIPLRAGDAVFVPAGTAHTIGPGLVLCEVQQNSDLTYRVYDYNRRDAQGRARELHIAKALDVMRFGKQIGGKVEPVRVRQGPLTATHFAACRYFATEQWEFSERINTATSREHFDLLIFLDGSGSIQWGADRAEYAPAQVWLLPAALGDYLLAPDARTLLLRTYVPGDLKELGRRLAEQGVAEADWSGLVHR